MSRVYLILLLWLTVVPVAVMVIWMAIASWQRGLDSRHESRGFEVKLNSGNAPETEKEEIDHG